MLFHGVHPQTGDRENTYEGTISKEHEDISCIEERIDGMAHARRLGTSCDDV